MFVIRRFRADEWAAYRAIRLHALADSPDAFGSTLASEEVRSDEIWRERLMLAEHSPMQFPLAAELDDALIALAWGRIDAERYDVATIYQMWVAPESRGIGVGAAILGAIIEWARMAGANTLELSVTSDNTAAHRLYTRTGFHPSGPLEALRPRSSLFAQPMRLVLRGESHRE